MVDETAGTWGNAKKVPGTASLNVGGDASVTSLSSASAGNCSAGGSYIDSSGNGQVFVVDEAAGTWGNAEEVPGTASLDAGGDAYGLSLSCASADNSARQAGGTKTARTRPGVRGRRDSRHRGNAEEIPGIASLNVGGMPPTCRSPPTSTAIPR